MASTVFAPSRRPPREASRRSDRVSSRIRRIAVVAALVALLPAVISYVSAMTGPSNTALGVRSVEWLRDNGAAGIVAQIETWYYSLTAPSKGGPTLKALPKVGHAPTVAVAPRLPVTERPQSVAAMIQPALAGEGVWRPTRTGLGTAPPLLVTTLRDEPAYPRVVIGLAWIDTKRTQISLYAGRIEPTVALPTRAMEVPLAARSRLLGPGSDEHGVHGAIGIGARERQRLQRALVDFAAVVLDRHQGVHHSNPSSARTATTSLAASAPRPRIRACLPDPGGSDSERIASREAGRAGVLASRGFRFARRRPGTDG